MRKQPLEIKSKLDFMHDGTKIYFEKLSKIVEDGFIKDFIYDQTFGIVAYPEGEKRKSPYFQYKAKENIPDNLNELMYRIYY